MPRSPTLGGGAFLFPRFLVLSLDLRPRHLVGMEGPLQEPPRLFERLEAVDKEIRAWGRMTRDESVRQLLSLGLESRAAIAAETQVANTSGDGLVDSVNYHSKKRNGELESVSIRFLAEGLFLEKGVGRGRKVGSAAANAAAKPWLTPLLPAAVEDLANRLAEGYADVVAAESTLRIPGILETKIR